VAACLGGVDLNACFAACKDAACTIACANKLNGVQPTAQCTRTPAADAKCNGG
jgi:hypothetical protein